MGKSEGVFNFFRATMWAIVIIVIYLGAMVCFLSFTNIGIQTERFNDNYEKYAVALELRLDRKVEVVRKEIQDQRGHVHKGHEYDKAIYDVIIDTATIENKNSYDYSKKRRGKHGKGNFIDTKNSKGNEGERPDLRNR